MTNLSKTGQFWGFFHTTPHPFIRKRPTHAGRLALFFTCVARYTGLTLSRRRYRTDAPLSLSAHLISAAHLTGKNCLRFAQKCCYAGRRSWRMGWLGLIVVSSLAVTPVAFARPIPTAPNTLSASAKQLARQGFLVLFYLPTCPHCQRFAPVITRFARHYHLELVTVSLNGQALPTLPQTTPLTPALHQAFFNGQAAAVPALFYVDATNAKILPVSMGEATPAQLTLRLNQLAPQVFQAEAKGVSV